MNPLDTTLPWDELLQHGRFVRALARTLVRDAAQADDVAQASWLAAARHPPSGVASLRCWLAQVVRNVARQEQRGERRRSAREAVTAQDESSVASADAAAAQLETQALLLAAVQALDPKYRAVVTLRFYEELPPRAIAARLALPVATVNTQLQRALEQLRVALDAKSDGARERWMRALAPVALEATVSVPGLLLAVAAVVLLLVSGVWWRLTVTSGDAASVAVVATNGEDAAVDESLLAALPGVIASVSGTSVPLASEARVVTGRVVDAAGRPIEGATVELGDGFTSDDLAGTPRTATTGADGGYSFDAVARGRHHLLVRKASFTVARRFIRIDPQTASDRGATVVLFAARRVAGRVVDASGEPIADARLVAFDETLLDRFEWPETATGSDGRFTLDGVPTCRVWLDVVAFGCAKQRVGPVVAGSAALAEFGDIVLVAEPRATLDLRAFDAAGEPLRDGRLGFTLLGEEDTEFSYFRMPKSLEQITLPSNGHLVTDQLPNGSYQFQVWSPTSRFDPYRFDATLASGATTVIEQRAAFTQGAARVHGTLRDSMGAPLADRVVALAATSWSDPIRVTTSADGSFEAPAPCAAGSRLSTWIEDEDEVLVGSAAPYAVVEATCNPSAPLALTATDAAALRGVIVHDDGTPVLGARLEAAPVGATGDDDMPQTTTDLDGAFEFRGLAPSERAVCLRVACGELAKFVTLPDEHELVAGATVAGLRIVLPRLASIAGRVVDPDGAPITGAIVACHDGSNPLQTVSAADGSFRFARVAPGSFDVDLEGSRPRFSVSFGTVPTRQEPTQVTLLAGEAREGLELVEGDAPDARLVHGTIELPPGIQPKDGELGVALRSATANATTFGGLTEFRFEGIAAAEARLVALFVAKDPADGPAAWTVVFGPEVVVVPGGAALRVPLPAPADSTVQIHFVDAQNAPSRRPIDVTVELDPPPGGDAAGDWNGNSVTLNGVLDELSIRGLAPGRYRLRLPPTVIRDFTVTGSGTLDLGGFELPSPPRLEGIVTDASGAPFAGAKIGVARSDHFDVFEKRVGDPFDPSLPIVTLGDEGTFSIESDPHRNLIVCADGYAPRWLRNDPRQLREEPIVLLPAGHFELTGFPREIADSGEWRFALVSLESEEARCGYARQFGPLSGGLRRTLGCYAIPAGLYAACFWKGPAGRRSSNEPLPEQTVPHEAYRWTVTVRPGETTTIDLSREW